MAWADLSARLPRLGLSLFWRTFFLLSLLLVGSTVAWLQTFRALEFEPRAVQMAQQVASMVNLSRAALVHSDPIARLSLIKTLSEEEQLVILPREPDDRFRAMASTPMDRQMQDELINRLGPGTVLASQVNDEPGFWVGFDIHGDPYWMQLDSQRFSQVGGRTWLVWLAIAAVLSFAGSAVMARLINRPLKQLSVAAGRVRDGDFDAGRLDERVVTSEIREVNIGFNRMAEQLAKIDQDRAVMLAGISHDLRTPLARLRLETEMSVADAEAREHMAADIGQLDAIIDKFLDYARPGQASLHALSLLELVQTSLAPFNGRPDLRVKVEVPGDLLVMAEEVELARVLANLIENASRYGRTPDTGVAELDISAKAHGDWVLMQVRDHGPGVPDESLPLLVKPFFRGDVARTAATGAGLGLAIVEKMVQRMGGSFVLAHAPSGGLAAHLKLHRAKAPVVSAVSPAAPAATVPVTPAA